MQLLKVAFLFQTILLKHIADMPEKKAGKYISTWKFTTIKTNWNGSGSLFLSDYLYK